MIVDSLTSKKVGRYHKYHKNSKNVIKERFIFKHRLTYLHTIKGEEEKWSELVKDENNQQLYAYKLL